MEKISLVLSIAASIGTLLSLILNMKLKSEVKSLKQIEGRRNVENDGNGNIINTGDYSSINK